MACNLRNVEGIATSKVGTIAHSRRISVASLCLDISVFVHCSARSCCILNGMANGRHRKYSRLRR